MATGECNCGAVTFDISVTPKQVFVCHCSLCRRNTGGPGVAVTLVENGHFHWLSGEELVNTWRKPGHDWEASFCTVCGSAVPGKNDEGAMYVPVSLLNTETDNLTVTAHLFVGSKAPWEEIGDEGAQFVGAYED